MQNQSKFSIIWFLNLFLRLFVSHFISNSLFKSEIKEKCLDFTKENETEVVVRRFSAPANQDQSLIRLKFKINEPNSILLFKDKPQAI